MASLLLLLLLLLFSVLLLGLSAAGQSLFWEGGMPPVAPEEEPPWPGAALGLLQDSHLEPECRELLAGFANSSVRLSGCLVRNARPVTLCQNCHRQFRELSQQMENITRSPGVHCLKNNSEGLSNSTVTFLALFNESLACFEHNLQTQEDNLALGNHSDVCKNCNVTYKKLNDMYNHMQKSGQQEESGEQFHLCIDVEDAMNITRRLWSTTFNCSVPCSDTVPVIAVSSFILFLPVVFYLSSFLHSKQKKRILMPSKRFQANDSSVNIQEKNN
ncbi:hypothetical protein JD844_024294 [Phrynosoma platyrhinos]|uniref:Osteopetrosis associated transmembrane protein 1 n=1 Tax=Phrynosoma platyrhinos TaxID=52577 RepID=A0ABQ7SXL7_PHRPL|nr:hypothetical protein JD844_024294 [Phrynosoma platyrhinos]